MKESLILFTILCLTSADERAFPKDFLFGAASSSYQIEGGWNASGKGESIWDRYVHTQPDKIVDGSTGDIACDSYHKFKEDVKLLKNLGVQFYRFSLSWPRILPTGYANIVNPDGIRYYNDLINELLANGIQPMVTLYHWDLPQPIQDLGGWPNPLIADYFEDFARVAFEHFGDRVKSWMTINEPYHICESGYGNAVFAPGYADRVGKYMCAYTVLLAHAKAYHLYDKEFRPSQKGQISITIDTFWYEPKTDKPEDVEAAEQMLQINFGLYCHPIYSKTGDWSPTVKQLIQKYSESENRPRTILPPFTKEQIEYIRGTSDLFGFNHYSTIQVEATNNPDYINIFRPVEVSANLNQPDEWEPTQTFWIKITPWGLRKVLNWIKKEYDNPEVIITENGVGDTEVTQNDETRIKYYKAYIGAVLEAIKEDGCNVRGYTAWSLLDSYEWNSGYTLQFGLHIVDFKDPERKRIPKASALYYKKVIQTRRVDHDYEPISNKTEL